MSPSLEQDLDRLVEVMGSIARGNYTNDIMEMTTPDHPVTVRLLAEAMAFLMVKVEAREFHLQQLVQANKDNTVLTVAAMAEAVGARDSYTKGHAMRVAELSARLGNFMALSEDEVHWIRLGGILHDVGKIGFSDKVFQNEDTVPSPAIMAEIKDHPTKGAEILDSLKFLEPALSIVRCHHERLDGTGYPLGLKGDEIPLGARIVAVVDSFDAMTTDRPYQKGMTTQEAFVVLKRLAVTGLDKKVVDAFCEMLGGEKPDTAE